jgi:hypothetical protein
VQAAVTIVGSVRVGAVVSALTLTVNEFVLAFPALSTAVHLTVLAPTGKRLPEAGMHVSAGFGSQASEAVTVKVVGAPLGLAHPTVIPVGTLMSGAVLSDTVTVKAHVPELPLSSTAVHVTRVVPAANNEPATGVHVTVGSAVEQRLVAEALKETAVPVGPAQSTAMFVGQDKVMQSFAQSVLTITANEPWAVLAE